MQWRPPSKGVPSQASRMASASSVLVIFPPRQSRFESLWARVIFPMCALVQSEARTPENLFAMMLMPMPVEQMRMPRCASPRETAPATCSAKSG